MENLKSSDITIRISLNDKSIPKRIEWKAQDDPNSQEFTESKAVLVSLFDKETKDTLKIDLWTTEFQVDEMDRFMYQTLKGLADTYHKATKNTKMANDMQKFVDYFAEEVKIFEKK